MDSNTANRLLLSEIFGFNTYLLYKIPLKKKVAMLVATLLSIPFYRGFLPTVTRAESAKHHMLALIYFIGSTAWPLK
jgi:hypothetical protein